MSGKERGLLRIIFKKFIASFKPTRHKLIGEDNYGTKYYEIENPRSSKKNSPRYFVPVNTDDYTQEVPVEWEAWLRYRRKDPPSREEIEQNYQLQMIKKRNAAEVEAKYASNGLQKLKQLSEGECSAFPIYEEYKNYGQDYKRRKDPPSREEIEQNYQLQMIKKRNAVEVEAKYASNGLQKLKQLSEGECSAFPIYEEYKNYGQDYKVEYDKRKQKKDK